ncbi:TonB-dependent receptor family protein [Pontibacter ruber]|uniref:Outer membrane beta-barrel protein n=1 Tax=Pontibacter ruber TaxID=1343895 RepID=A0ABW5CVR1_9BACT|nr:TonB-dependent receptor family protein [Pontibacter ruber]
MNTNLLKTLGAAILSLSAFTSFAQTNQGHVAGTVQDSLKQQAVPFATIVLKKYADAAFVQATVTDEKGNFKFEALPQGLYFVTADFLGYKKKQVDSVQVEAAGKLPALHIALAEDTPLLKEVTVVGHKPFIEQQADKLVLNVAESPIAAGGTTDEVISRAPGVVEQNGGYQIRGKQALVLIDGKTTNLKGADLKTFLSSMPTNGIAKVEVIANPSAKYDADGGAVINIVTTKSKNFGANGTLTLGAGAGQKARYNTGLSLNHRTQKLNVYGSYDYQHSQPYTTLYSNRFLNQESRIQEQSHELRTINTQSFKAGLDYDLSAKTSFGILMKGIVTNRNRKGDNTSVLTNANGAAGSSSIVATDGKSEVVSPSINLFYKTVLDPAGTELRIGADYFQYNKSWQNQFVTHYFNAAGEENLEASYLRDNSPADNTIKTATIDLVRPVKNGTLEAGVKSTFTKTDNDILWEGRTAGSNWNTDLGKTNHFIYQENIHAAYAVYRTRFGKFDLQAGLRAEQTNTTGTSVTLDQTDKDSYFNLFPTVSVQHSVTEKQQVGFAYRKKIDRFRFDIVNPFVTYISQYAYAQGNPHVKPSISHNFEASYTFDNQLFAALNYAYHTNVLTEVVRLLPGSQAVVNSYDNFKSADEWSGTLTHVKSLFADKWSTTNTVGFMYANVHAGQGAQFNKGRMAAMLMSNNIFQLRNGFRGEILGSYSSPMTFGAYAFKARYSASLGLSKSVLKKAGTLTLNVTDVFNTSTNRYEANSFGVMSVNETKAESQFVRLNFTYKFGNKNVKASKNRRAGNEEEKKRMEGNAQ